MASKGSTQREGAMFLAIEVVHLRLYLSLFLIQQKSGHAQRVPSQCQESL